jgi:peptide/nickel transport system substrate-binding protein
MSNSLFQPQGALSGFSRRDILRLSVASGVAVTASGLLTACTSGRPSDQATGSFVPQRGGTLRVGMISEGSTETIDSWLFNGTTGYLRIVSLYDSLLEFDDELVVQPSLAESREASTDKKTWTFRLRDGVTFHDGSSLTADDAIHNIRTWADPNSWPYSNGGSAIDPDLVTKLDDLTVRIGLREPNAQFDRTLAFLAFSIKSRNEKPGGSPVGTGPFKFVSFTPGARSEFERFKNHWRSEPVYLDRLVVDSSFTDENSRTNALKGGQIDLAPSVSFGLAKTIPAGTAQLLRSRSGALSNLYMAVDTAPFDDVNVRQAMRLLVDRKAMVEVTFAGYGSVSNDVPGRYTPYYDESLVRERDVDQAKFLLKKAGKEGLTVNLQTSAVGDPITQAATLFQQQAKDAGVTVNLEQIDPGAYWSRYGELGFAQTWYFPVHSLAAVWTGTFVSTGSLNETHWYNSPLYERTKTLVREAKATEDESKLTEIWHELQQQQFDEGGHINYGTYDYVDAVATSVQGLTPSKYLFASGCNLRKAWLVS